MPTLGNRWIRLTVLAFALATIAGQPAASARQEGTTTRTGTPPAIAGAGQTNWASDNLDLYNQRFSEIHRIDTANVGQLQRRWSHEAAPGLYVGQNTPLVVDGVMYFHAGGTALAVNAVTSLEISTGAIERVRGVDAARARREQVAAGERPPEAPDRWLATPGRASEAGDRGPEASAGRGAAGGVPTSRPLRQEPTPRARRRPGRRAGALYGRHARRLVQAHRIWDRGSATLPAYNCGALPCQEES